MIHSEKNVWLTIIAVEVTFIVLTRIVLAHYWTYSLDAELIRTPLRIVAVLFYWGLLGDRLSSRNLSKTEILDFRVLSALVLFLSVPILVGDLSYMTPFARVVYAATSIFVALKEEIAFRALIQNLLARRYGQLTAIVATSALFTCYHIGAVPLTVFAYGQVLIASLILGIVYARTQNLWLVIGLHTVYDALWSLTPIGTGQLFPYMFGLWVLVVSLLFVTAWGRSALGRREANTQ